MPAKKPLIRAIALFSLGLMASLPAQAGLIPNGNGLPDCGASCSVNLVDYGGPVMTGTTHAYIVWYGDWSQAAYSAAQTRLPLFFNSLTGSSYMNIALSYPGTPVSNTVEFGGAYDSTLNLGNSLSDDNILQLVQNAQGTLNGGVADPNGVYFVYTAPGISEQQDQSACGWHTNAGSTKYAWVSAAPGCDLLGGSVTGNAYVDSLTETSSHELFESLTDPYVGDASSFAPPLAWYDQTYGEVGDMCVNSNFGAQLNGNTFDVQAIWSPAATTPQGGMCAAGYTQDAVVPEPGSLALALLALSAIPAVRRRSRAAH